MFKIFKILILLSFVLSPISIWAQKDSKIKENPSIMVMPSDNWCIERGYYTTQENPKTGKKNKYPDYKKAFQENKELGVVISKVGELFSERGFPLKSMEQKLKSLKEDKALDAAEEGGMGTKKTLKEKLLNKAKSDIILYLQYYNKKEGPYNQITFSLTAIDPYINEQVGASSGTSEKNSGSVDKLLTEAVLKNIDNLQSQMQDYFDDLNENGRKIKIRVKVSQSSSLNLKSKCGDYDLARLFEAAATKNAVNNKAKVGQSSTNIMEFDLIRIPMIVEVSDPFGDGTQKKSNNADLFADKMIKMIKGKCKDINAKFSVTKLGLGKSGILIKLIKKILS